MSLRIPKAEIVIRPLFPHELEAYFHLRYASARKHHPRLLKSLKLKNLEIDMFDYASVHIGSFLKGKMIGCIRFTVFPEAEKLIGNKEIFTTIKKLDGAKRNAEEIPATPSLPSSLYLNQEDHFRFETYLQKLLKNGKKISEIGRLINLEEGKLFRHLIEMINYVWAYYLMLGIDYCFFNCSKRHVSYYSRQIESREIFQQLNFGKEALSPRSMLEVEIAKISSRCKAAVERNLSLFQEQEGPCPISLLI